MSEFLDSPITILSLRRKLFRVLVNDVFLIILSVAEILNPDVFGYLYPRFPWLFISLVITANVIITLKPNLGKLDPTINGTFPVILLLFMRLVYIGRMNQKLMAKFTILAFMIKETSQFIFWGSFGFSATVLVPFFLVEALGMILRLAHFRRVYAASYEPLQLNCACLVVIAVHLLLYSYMLASSFHYHKLSTAAVKLRQYISRFTLQKNPTLHLGCILMPPLVKKITDIASRHDGSPHFKGESSTRRIVTAANQVLLLARAIEMHLRVEWRVLQFHWNDFIDVQRLLDGIIDRLPSAEGASQSRTQTQPQQAYEHKNHMITRDCNKEVFCNAKYLTFVLEAVLMYSLAVNRRKRAEVKGKNSMTRTHFVNLQEAKIKAKLEKVDIAEENARHAGAKNALATHFLKFHISFGGRGSMRTSSSGDKVVQVHPVLFAHEKQDNENGDLYSEAGDVDSVTYRTSLELSAVSKIVHAFGGCLSIRETHDPQDASNTTHLILLSIPCLLPVTSDCGEDDGDNWRNHRISRVIDFGMDSPSDDLFEHTCEIFEMFSLKIERVSDDLASINLYRVVFVSSGARCSELRAVGYTGQVVVVTPRGDQAELVEGADHILEIPYTPRAMDTFFRSMTLEHSLTRQPKLLTTLDRAVLLLRPHRRVPIVSWTIQALLHANRLTSAPHSSTVTCPATSAYTPISADTGLLPSTAAGTDLVDYEYLTNNKVVASTLTHETIGIADNYLDETNFPLLTPTMLSDFQHWKTLNLFWETNHDFKPHFPSSLFRRYSLAAYLLNVYPFVAFLLLKLCVFLIFTAFNPRFNAAWNIAHGVYCAVVIGVLMVKPLSNVAESKGWRWRLRNVLTWMKAVAVPTLLLVDLLRLFFEVQPGGRILFLAAPRTSGWDGEPFGSYSGEELLFCLCLNPLSLYFLWTAGVTPFRIALVCIAAQIAFTCVAMHWHLKPFRGDVSSVMTYLTVVVYLLVGPEMLRGAACSRTLYLYHRKATYTQKYLAQLVYLFRKELRNPLKVLLESQKQYYQLCVEETLRGQVNLTPGLLDGMAEYRRTFLFLKEIQKHFSLQESLGVDVDRECHTPLPADDSPEVVLRPLPVRRIDSFHLIGELTELCRCFESDSPVPIRVFVQVCSSISITVQMDKELLISFLVNVMFQSVSNITTYPQCHPGTSDLTHEILIVVNKRPRDASSARDGDSHDIDHFDTLLDISVLDTGMKNILTQDGLLAGEGFQTEQGLRWSDGSSHVTCGAFDQRSPSSSGDLLATVYVQLQEYLFRKAVQRVGGRFRRCSVTRVHSSYGNEVSVSLPMYGNDSAPSLQLSASSSCSAADVMSSEYSQMRRISSYYATIYERLTWRWESITQMHHQRAVNPGRRAQKNDFISDESVTNFVGYEMSTSGTRSRMLNKYATTADVHPRRVLVVVAAKEDADIPVQSFQQQGWHCSVATSFEKLLSFPFHTLNRFDVILIANEFNRKYVSREGHQEVLNLFENLFYGFSHLHVPFVVCLVGSIKRDKVLMQPSHFRVERPFVDSLIDKIVLECDKFALQKLFY